MTWGASEQRAAGSVGRGRLAAILPSLALALAVALGTDARAQTLPFPGNILFPGQSQQAAPSQAVPGQFLSPYGAYGPTSPYGVQPGSAADIENQRPTDAYRREQERQVELSLQTELERYYNETVRVLNFGEALPDRRQQALTGRVSNGQQQLQEMRELERPLLRQFGYRVFRPTPGSGDGSASSQRQADGSGATGQSVLGSLSQQLGSGRSDDVFGALARSLTGQQQPGLLRAPSSIGTQGYSGASAPTDYLGAVDPSYVIGVGDVIEVTLIGGNGGRFELEVDNEGRVSLPGTAPLLVAGKAVGQVRDEVRERVAANFVGTQAFISVKSFRRIAVTVAGAVPQPGVVYTHSAASLASVLPQAGGISEAGSLRQLVLFRDGRRIAIDLYDLLVEPNPDVVSEVRDGDYLFVPQLGATYAVAGQVKRAGIYEFPPSGRPTLSEALTYSGGDFAEGAAGVIVARLRADGARELQRLPSEAPLQNLDVIYAVPSLIDLTNNVQVVRSDLPGYMTSASQAGSLAGLLRTPGLLLSDTYRFFAVLGRRTGQAEQHQYFGFSPVDVLAGRYDAELYGGDVVMLLSYEDLAWFNTTYLRREILQEQPLSAQATPYVGQRCRAEQLLLRATQTGGLTFVAGMVARLSRGNREELEQARRVAEATARPASPGRGNLASFLPGAFGEAQSAILPQYGTSQDGTTGSRVVNLRPSCPDVFTDRHAEAVLAVARNLVAVVGSVARPGVYPVPAAVTVEAAVDELGGGLLIGEPEGTTVEVSRIAQQQFVSEQQGSLQQVAATAIGPGAIVDVRRSETSVLGAVTVLGAVRNPGVYPITAKDSVLNVLLRAGGLREEAYAYGGVLTRLSAREAEERNIQRYIDQVRQFVVARGATAGGPTPTPATLEVIDALANRQLYGRVVTELDPTVLQVRPELDITVEPGDHIIIPRRNETVYVLGEVLNPGTFSFRAGDTVDDYVTRAGGATRFADTSAIIVVFPDGNARRVGVDAWNFTPVQVPPGSSIIASRDLEYLSPLETLEYVSRVASQVGISLASFSTLFDD